MRTMLLSFSADVFSKLVSGEKIYEHRKVFPSDAIEAYLYVSAPIKAVRGIMHLNNRVNIEDWRKIYSYDEADVRRIDEYLLHDRYAVEISDFQDTMSIPLEQLKKDVPGFVVPQMYYYIDDSYLLDYLKRNLKLEGDRLVHDFSSIKSNQICIL